MSRFAAVDVAIRLELLAQGRPIDPLFRFKAVPGPPVAGYGYDKTTMRRFLLGVADRLKRDDPPLSFAWRVIDVDQCLDADHLMLVSLIEDQIAADQPGPAKGASE